jgi:Phage integrase family
MSRALQSILDGVKQLRAYAKGRRPAIVVLYELAGLLEYLKPDNIAQCLYGPRQVHVAVPEDAGQEGWVLGSSYGGGRVATEHHNTTLSAVAVLRTSGGTETVSVFHNAFAAQHRHLKSKRVLCKSDGSSLTQDIVGESVRRAARKAGIPVSGAHRLRHTFCSHLSMRGAPARAIQGLAGHQDLITTQRYMHLSPAAIEGGIQLLEQPSPNGRGEMLETTDQSVRN